MHRMGRTPEGADAACCCFRRLPPRRTPAPLTARSPTHLPTSPHPLLSFRPKRTIRPIRPRGAHKTMAQVRPSSLGERRQSLSESAHCRSTRRPHRRESAKAARGRVRRGWWLKCVCVCVVAVHRTSRCLLPRFKEGDLRSSVRLKMDLTRRGTHHHSGRHVLHHPRRRSQSVRSPRTSFIVHFVTGCLFEEIIIAKTDGWRG